MIFEEELINDIYNKKVKKSIEYFNEKIPMKCPIKKWNYSWKDKDAPRCFCVKDFIKWTEKYNLRKCKNLGYTSEFDPELDVVLPEKKKIIFI